MIRVCVVQPVKCSKIKILTQSLCVIFFKKEKKTNKKEDFLMYLLRYAR